MSDARPDAVLDDARPAPPPWSRVMRSVGPLVGLVAVAGAARWGRRRVGGS